MAEPTYRYRALEPIAVGSVRAYNAGDWVPEENVELHGYEVGVQVERVEIPAVEDDVDSDAPPAQPLVLEAPPASEPKPALPAQPAAAKKPLPRPTPSA